MEHAGGVRKGNGALVEFNITSTNTKMVGDHLFLDSDTLIINWQMGVFCNYNCSYCWPGAHSDKYDYKKLSEYKMYIDNFVDIAIENGFKKIDFTMLGGELTAYKHFTELVEYLDQITEVEIGLVLVTNISPAISFWKRFFKNIKNIKIRFVASYHVEHADINEFLEKVKFITSAYENMLTVVNTVMSPANFDKLKIVVEKIKASGVRYKFNYQNVDEKNISPLYTQEMIDYIESINTDDKYLFYTIRTDQEEFKFPSASYAIYYGLTNFEGWNCIAGSESIIVSSDGQVYKCWTDRREPLGNLRTGFKLKKEKCTLLTCIKYADLCVKKWRD